MKTPIDWAGTGVHVVPVNHRSLNACHPAILAQSDQRAMFTNRVASFFLFWMDAFEQNQRGLISRDLWNTFDRDIPGYFANQGFHEVWQLIRNSFPPNFQKYIDETAKLDAANSPDFLARRNLVNS